MAAAAAVNTNAVEVVEEAEVDRHRLIWLSLPRSRLDIFDFGLKL